MTTTELLTRLLQRRPLTFWLPHDEWLLADGVTGGQGGWELVGTEQEDAGRHASELRLPNVMSYDEIALAALVCVSVPTHFINAGGRHNQRVPGERGTFEPKGVYTACVGARFERPGLMEWAHLVVSQEQNTAANGYGPAEAALAAGANPMRVALLGAWARFYGREYLPTAAEAQAQFARDPSTYLELRTMGRRGVSLLDAELYVRRIRASAEPFLLDANRRAAESGTQAYALVVGLGLGAWGVDQRQGLLQLQAYEQILTQNALPNLGVLDFSWFPHDCVQLGGARSGTQFASAAQPTTAPLILFSRRDPAAPLPARADPSSEPPYLNVAMYAWDGNSYPGNEYWIGALSASGDPAAACCSTIAVLQNPDLNPERMCGEAALVYGGGEGGAAPPPVSHL